MNKIYLLLSTLFLSFSLQSSTRDYSDSLNQARQDVVGFLRTATPLEIQNLSNYLEYYRSEGGYQAVAPAPEDLRESLSKRARELFKKITEYAKPLTKETRRMPGSSRLTQEGEEFYQNILTMFKSSSK